MAGILHRRIWVLLIAASAAFICWKWIPGSKADRAAFSGIVRSTAKPPFFIIGAGSHSQPWEIWDFAQKAALDPQKAPVIVSLGDDPRGVFQSSPPSPIDIAVILTNFQRLGIRRASTSAVLAWESPDPMGLAALDKAISRFDSLIMTAPLSRGAVPETMPAAFRKASIPLSTISGNSNELPIVNRIPIPGIILGGENAEAGFQSLDAEPTSAQPHLLARWGDRVVFAFPLLVAMQELHLPLELIEIRPGSHIKLAPEGPVVPIDRYGRLTLPLAVIPALTQIPAETIIDANDSLISGAAARSAILRDDHSSADAATRLFSKMLVTWVTAATSNAGRDQARIYQRLKSHEELLILFVICLILTAISRLRIFPRNVIFLSLAGLCAAVQFIALASMMLWLPGLAALSAIAAASLVCHVGVKVKQETHDS